MRILTPRAPRTQRPSRSLSETSVPNEIEVSALRPPRPLRFKSSPRTLLALALLALVLPRTGSAQFEMPDMKQMSGIPRPVGDLPNGTIAVRLIRGSLASNIAGHPVELVVNGKSQTAKTDDSGHAQFSGLPSGATAKTLAVVDGERLESQEFPVPAQGGIRLMLVATDKNAAPATSPAAEPVSGQVVIGGDSRIIVEPGDEAVEVYYLLDIMNTARVPVNPPSLFMFDMPTGAVGTSILDGSTPKATVNGTRVRVQGPFPPGRTIVQVAAEMPSLTGAVRMTQRFPANFEQLAIVVKKVGAVRLSSPQISAQQDTAAQGETYIAAQGNMVPAGQAIQLSLTDLPHHSPAARWTALTLAVLIIGIGLWAARAPEDAATRQAERRQLLARRDKLMADLVRLEQEHRDGRGDRARYAARRADLMAGLEQLYGALDDDTAPEPAPRPGVAA